MTNLRASLTVLGAVLLLLTLSPRANAQASRTWVSGVGDDANPCSRTAPCKTFAGAISKTAAGGEIDCLDPGGFGAVTITKAITIDCGSGPGGVLVSGTNGIVISANAATDVITLRHISVNGLGTGLAGVLILSAKVVHIIDLEVYGFTNPCIDAGGSSGVGASLILSIKDTKVHECGGGIRTNGAAGFGVNGDLDNVSIYSNGTGVGLAAANGSRVTVHNSTFYLNSIGIQQTQTGSSSVAMATNNMFNSNGTAVQSSAGSTMGVSGNVFSSNGTVYNQNGGSISSLTDNPTFQFSALGIANGTQISKN